MFVEWISRPLSYYFYCDLSFDVLACIFINPVSKDIIYEE